MFLFLFWVGTLSHLVFCLCVVLMFLLNDDDDDESIEFCCLLAPSIPFLSVSFSWIIRMIIWAVLGTQQYVGPHRARHYL